MIKSFVYIVSFLAGTVVAFAQGNDIRIVALVLDNHGSSQSAEAMVLSLEDLGAQILQVDQPNASEMRSVLRRFADVAIENDVALVYIDGAVLELGDRDFVVPSNLNLRRKSDLLTLSIPISAFARAAALAGVGGAVIAHSAETGITLVDGVKLAADAPAYRDGITPILLAAAGKDAVITSLFAQEGLSEEIDLTEVLVALSARDGISVSHLVDRQVMLRHAPVVIQPVPVVVESTVEVTTAPITVQPIAEITAEQSESSGLNLPQVTEEPVVEVVESDAPVVEAPEAESPEPALSLEMLQVLQNGLSRLEKRNIQRGLALGGHYRGLIDGVFGRQTARAISAYQESIDAEVTGVLTIQQMEDIK